MDEAEDVSQSLPELLREQRRLKRHLIRVILQHSRRFLNYSGFRQALLEDLEKADCLITLFKALGKGVKTRPKITTSTALRNKTNDWQRKK